MALKHGSEDARLSGVYTLKFGRDPCPVRRGLAVVGGSVVCEERFFFAVRAGFGTEQEKPEPCAGFSTTKGKAFFIFCFPIP